jgi:predicted nucleotidyltransferase
MVKKKVRTIIDYFTERLRERKVNISKIILFGSHATGHSHLDSDIDIVVVSSDFRNKNIFKRIEIIKEAEIKTIKKYKIPLDVIVLTPEEYENKQSIIAEYAQNGRILFAV